MSEKGIRPPIIMQAQSDDANHWHRLPSETTIVAQPAPILPMQLEEGLSDKKAPQEAKKGHVRYKPIRLIWYLVFSISAFGCGICTLLGCISPQLTTFGFINVNTTSLAEALVFSSPKDASGKVIHFSNLTKPDILPDFYIFGMSGLCRARSFPNGTSVTRCTYQFAQPFTILESILQDVQDSKQAAAWQTVLATEEAAIGSKPALAKVAGAFQLISVIVAPITFILYFVPRMPFRITLLIHLCEGLLVLTAVIMWTVVGAIAAGDIPCDTVGCDSIGTNNGIATLWASALGKFMITPLLAAITLFVIVKLLSFLFLLCKPICACCDACGRCPVERVTTVYLDVTPGISW